MFLPNTKKALAGLMLGFIFVLFVVQFPTTTAYAASVTSVGIANYVSIIGNHAENGDIIVNTAKGYALSTKTYDAAIAGVIDDNTAMAFKNTKDTKTFPLVETGIINVKVNRENGNIKKGDFITSSSMKGVGMKADKGGYVVGKAMEDISFQKPSDVKRILVNVKIQMVEDALGVPSFLVSFLSLSSLAASERPIKVFQYVVAAVIVIASFAFGFLIFARVVNTGIQALGRNPLAGRMIQLSIVFNVVLIIIIIMAGVSIAYILIRL